jgi:hypothetical protein
MRVGLLLCLLSFLLFSSAQVSSQSAPDAILSSDNPGDQAVASLLAKHLNATAISTEWGFLDNDSIEALVDLGVRRIYIVGGEAAIPDRPNGLTKQGISILKRFNGSNRYTTSALVAREWRNTSRVVLANGYDEEGITNALQRAEIEGAPLMLVPRDHIPPEVNETITSLSPKKIVLFPAPDAIQNFLLKDVSYFGVRVEVVQEDHQIKTRNLISLANATILVSEDINFSFEDNSEEVVVAGKLIEESKESLISSKEFFDDGMYNFAFTEAVLARFRAFYSMLIKRGAIKIPKVEDPVEQEKTPQNASDKIRISQILLNPAEYEGKEVIISAEVEEAVEISGKAFIKLFDGSGRIIATFPAERELMISRGLIFMADPDIIGRTVVVNGTVRLNVPLGEGEGHGAFAYLLEINSARPY